MMRDRVHALIRAIATVLMTIMPGCSSPRNVDPGPLNLQAPPVVFREVTEEAGFRFIQTNGATGQKYLPETMGSGCAFLDYDNDGWQDILLVNGDYWPGHRGGGRPTLKLYRNDHRGHFTDMTHAAGLDTEMYGMGVAVGDYDNDGYDDVYVTGVGGCRLFHNEPDSLPSAPSARRFRDVTSTAGVASPGWATSATWVDYDRDGRLDLFVCHYVKWSRKENLFFTVDGVTNTYATPEQYPGESCRLYHNEGNGRFKDVTQAAGIFSTRSKSLGVVAFDFDQDGRPDLLVTNDTEPNFLFHNQGDGTFKEVALELGIAVSEEGKAKAGMGADVGDEQNSGHESIVITNFSGEQLTLYRREPTGHYLDVAARSGIGNASQYYLGFGVFFFDYDGDGLPDIFVANGHIQGDVGVRQTAVEYREPALLLRNLGGGTYANVTDRCGEDLQAPQIGRGAAWGDYDNDGYPDILLTSNFGDPKGQRTRTDGLARLLHNDNHTGNHWLRLRLEGVGQSNRDAFGARVTVRAGPLNLSQTVKGASSYLSQSDRRLLFGLGPSTRADEVEIQWPDGQVQSIGPQAANVTLVVREGGKPAIDRH